MKVRAVVTQGQGIFSIEEVEIGAPQVGEVMVQIKASGVCHTDLKSTRWGPTLIMGHEGAGVVLEVGAGVTSVVPGDRVVLNWAMPCGACFQCRRGAANLCEQKPRVPDERFRWKGSAINTAFNLGTMSTVTVVPHQAVVKIQVEIPFTSACILGCCVMTGYGSVHHVA